MTSQAFLGITAACARCHDHKFDPIPQKDYYALAGIFRSTETCYGTIRFIQSQRPQPDAAAADDCGLPPATTEKLGAAEREAHCRSRSRTSTSRSRRPPTRSAASSPLLRSRRLRSRLDSFDYEGNPKLQAMGVRDKPAARGRPGMGPGGRPFGPGGFVPKKGGRPFGGFGGTFAIGDSPVYTRGEPDKPQRACAPRHASGDVEEAAVDQRTAPAAGSNSPSGSRRRTTR